MIVLSYKKLNEEGKYVEETRLFIDERDLNRYLLDKLDCIKLDNSNPIIVTGIWKVE